ncbi:MAG TPA: hypothetical protein VHR18_00050 [Solirubrobacterales bacterium]|nr:hypothetical protein [Solirubrobacterales bacterium]
MLDWLVVNERLISVQRLRNLVRDDADRALVEAALGWLGQRRRRPRLGAKPGLPEDIDQPEPFFRDSPSPFGELDEAFLAQGFLKSPIESSGNSEAPDLELPINFAFRLRALLGIGARAEVVRALLTSERPWINVQAIAASTAYAKRNAQEALNSLQAAGVLSASELRNDLRFDIPRQRWMQLLDLDEIPRHVDWPQLFAAYRLFLRWLWDPRHEQLSEYMLASEARTLVEEVEPDLRFAGVPINAGRGAGGPTYLDDFAEQLREWVPI